jgi:hypothetical protein
LTTNRPLAIYNSKIPLNKKQYAIYSRMWRMGSSISIFILNRMAIDLHIGCGWLRRWRRVSQFGSIICCQEGEENPMKSVLESILLYWASIVVAPKGILTNIRKVIFHFLWSSSHQSSRIALVKWNKVASPKEFGGWGLKNIYIFAQALVIRSLWTIMNYDLLWSRVMKSKYLPQTSMEEWF